MREDISTMGIDPKKYYTVAETADIFGVHRYTIWRWVKSMRLQGRTRIVNNRTEFRGTELLKLLERI